MEKRNRDEMKRYKALVGFIFSICVGGLFAVNYEQKHVWQLYLGVYGSIMVVYMLSKMLLSFFYKPVRGNTPDMKVSVIIPSYNEKPEAVLTTVNSILEQDYPIHEVFFIDDGSKDTSGYEAIKKLSKQHPNLIVHKLAKNSGKRHAQLWAFKRFTGEVFVTVDSDGYLYPDAVRNLVTAFQDEKVMGVTGHINARNKHANWFTRLLDMRYDNAFRVERAAQSVCGTVLVCSGPISAYRRGVIDDNMDHYENQTFLGNPVQYGDDRCLTNYAIKKGRTVYQSSAKCDTDVPDNIGQFLKQQIRWNKSFFRESLLALRLSFQQPRIMYWVVCELLLWILFGFVIILAVIFKAKTFGLVMLVYYLGYICISAWARNVFYILKHPLIFFMAPLYGIIHLGLLFPLRIYALLTLKSTGWGTR